MKSLLSLVVVLASLPLCNAFASGTCRTRVVSEITSSPQKSGKVRRDRESKDSSVVVQDLEECSASGRALLGKEEVGPHYFPGRPGRSGKGHHSRGAPPLHDTNSTFKAVKVVMHYLDDTEGSRSVKIKYKYE